jgi:hypothetical protein
MLQHFFTLLRQMDAGKNSDVIDKLPRLKIGYDFFARKIAVLRRRPFFPYRGPSI